MSNPNDEIRHRLLTYFYERNAKATSILGKRGSAVKISDVKKDLKALYGLSQQQVVSNLTYLIDRRWVKTDDVEKTVLVAGGTIPSTVKWYQVTSDGIDKFEGESEFRNKERYAGINVTATGINTITLGDGNIVNARYEQLHIELSTLKDAVTASSSLPDSEKLDLAVDIESIKDQLAKAEPDKNIIRHLWDVIEYGATAAGLGSNVSTLAALIANLFA